MPTYHIRRTATFVEHYAVQAETEEDALEYVADDAIADVVEDMGDGEFDVYQVDPDPTPATTAAAERDEAIRRARLLLADAINAAGHADPGGVPALREIERQLDAVTGDDPDDSTDPDQDED